MDASRSTTPAFRRADTATHWVIDSMARLLAVHMLVWSGVGMWAALVGGGGGWNPISWAIVSYFGGLIGAVIYLPLLVASARLTTQWRLTALTLSPVFAMTAALTDALLLGVPLSWFSVSSALATAVAYGVVVPPPEDGSIRHAPRWVAVAMLAVAAMFVIGRL